MRRGGCTFSGRSRAFSACRTACSWSSSSKITKSRDRPAAAASRRSSRTQRLWKVEIQLLRGCPSSRRSVRSFISPAALLVKVTARIASEATPLSRIRWPMRWVMTRVLPLPAPARIRVGPSVASTASRCWSFEPREQRRLVRVIATSVGRLYSTVTDLARLRGWSTSRPARTATWYAISCRGRTMSSGDQTSSTGGHVEDEVGALVEDLLHLGVALEGDGDDAAAAGLHFLDVGQHLVVRPALRAQRHHRHALVDERDGAVLHLPRRVTLGVDVGDLLHLQGAFERDRVVDAAAEVQEVAGGGHPLRHLLHPAAHGQRVLHEVGHPGQALQQLAAALVGEGPAQPAQVQGQERQGHDLRREGLGGGDADLGAGVGEQRARGLARHLRALHVADRDGQGAEALGLLEGGQGVGGLPALRDGHGEGLGAHQRRAVAELAAVVDLRRHARHLLQEVLADQRGVPARPAGEQHHALGALQLRGRGAELLQVDFALPRARSGRAACRAPPAAARGSPSA